MNESNRIDNNNLVNTDMDRVVLPPLKIEIKHNLGKIIHILSEESTKVVTAIREIQISPRIKEKIYILEDNQQVIITTRNKLVRPAGVDGILIKSATSSCLRWANHKTLDDFNRRKPFLAEVSKEICNGWNGQFGFRTEIKDTDGKVNSAGLRPPQIGGLHSIGAHWSTNNQIATVVMPTGTGKTETMISSLIAYSPHHILIIVPSRVLREQTAEKFVSLGKLRELGCIPHGLTNPIVGVISKRITSIDDLDIFDNCNVVISTMSALTGKENKAFTEKIADKVEALYIDEAHHIGAKSWTEFRELFKNKKILQFTATPYRSDGVIVDGKVIYEYQLQQAQKDGYFNSITFEPIYEIDQTEADKAIAESAIQKLRSDIQSGYTHVMMVRCSSIDRAKELLILYNSLASDLNPVLIHSEIGNATPIIENIRNGKNQIAICVNMLGEGFDLPELKIAAVHDTHKSLAVLLQFIGRFTRTSNKNIGNASVIANIGDENISTALERLYSEDADWNKVLSEFSSDAAKSHKALIDFLNDSEKFEKTELDEDVEISHFLLRPTFNTLIFEANTFNPKKFFEGLNENSIVHSVWLHQKSNTLYFVAKNTLPIKWTRSRELVDLQWSLFVLHYDPENKILFLSSSDKASLHENMAYAVGATKLISGDTIFRCLGNINRLIFQNIGVRKYGRRNLRFALYTGADVAEALSITEKTSSIKSNLSGTGWENGKPVTIGCSYKGRVWSREIGTIPEFISWCENVGSKIKNASIDTTKIIENVLIPEEITSLPNKQVLGIDWPLEILRQSEDRITINKNSIETAISDVDLVIDKMDYVNNKLSFHLRTNAEDSLAAFTLSIDSINGFSVIRTSSETANLKIGIMEKPIEQFFSDYPPLIRFIDLSEMDGNLLIKPQNEVEFTIPPERFDVWNWDNVDITKESIWKNNQVRKDSIQWYTAQQYINGNYDVVFDDDDAGEVSDLICLKEEHEFIRLVLIHCKYSQSSTPGERVKDVVEVCSQAIRSAKWKWKFRDMCRHAISREKKALRGRETRLLRGNTTDINKFSRLSRFKEIKPEIVIVQPGLKSGQITSEQTAVLAAAYSYLKETIGVDLDIICSS